MGINLINLFTDRGSRTIMRLLVLYETSQITNLNQVTNNCKTLGIQLIRVPWNKKWDLYKRTKLDQLIKETDYVLILEGSRLPQGNLLHFMIGLFLGRNKPVLFLCQGASKLDLPPWRDIRTLENTMELFHQLKELKKEWTQEQRKQQGRQKLEGMGIEVSTYALFEAVSLGHFNVLQAFLEAGFSENTKNNRGVYLLNEAVRKGHTQIVEYLLNQGCELNQPSEDRENTPLMDGAAENQLEIVDLLLARGAELNHVSKNGQTALMLAIGQGYYEIAKHLIDGGADFRIKDKLGMDAVTYCKLFRHEEILNYLDPYLKEN